MNYKALEDLINILVKKTGTDIKANVANFEKNKIDDKLQKSNKDKVKFKNQMSTKKYIDSLEKEKDNNEKNSLEKSINLLEENLKSLKEEVESYYKVDETGEIHLNTLSKEIFMYEQDLRNLEREIKHAKENSLSTVTALENEKENIFSKLKKSKNELKRKYFLDEEIIRISDEIYKNKNNLNEVKTRITSSTYEDTLEKASDEETIKNIEKEINILLESQKNWDNNAEVLGNNILKDYKDGKKYNDVSHILDKLVSMAELSLKITQKEIKNSNIFSEMEKYNKLMDKLKDKLSKSKYIDNDREIFIAKKKEYYSTKIKTFKANLKEIEARKVEAEHEIDSVACLYETTKNNRIDAEMTLLSLQNRFYSYNITQKAEKEVKDLEKYIGLVKEDIENDKKLENEYVRDVYGFKEELRNLDVNFNTIKMQIEELSKKSELINSEDSLNKIEILNDNLLLLEYEDRLTSLTHEQQYLYVDPAVIKEEIKNIWEKKKNNNNDLIENIEEDSIPDIIEIDDNDLDDNIEDIPSIIEIED